MKNCTALERAFVREYLNPENKGNGAECARKAGYSVESARETAYALLKKPHIAAAVEAEMERRDEIAAFDAIWVLTRLATVAERCMQAEPVLDRDGKETGEYRFDSSGANRSLELIGKYRSMFVERHESTGKDGAPLPPATVNVVLTEEMIEKAIAKKQDEY